MFSITPLHFINSIIYHFFENCIHYSMILKVIFYLKQVKYISNDKQFAEMTTYRDAQKLCRRYAQLFSSMIKLSPELDTDQKVIMHVPTDPSVMRQVDEALRALDLVTDISFTGEPKDHMLDSSDSGSINSDDQILMPKGGTLEDLEEFKGRESQTHV